MTPQIPPSSFRLPRSRRGRPRIIDEFTYRDDLTASQKQWRRICRNRNRPLPVPGEGPEARSSRVDLGLALLSLVAKPGVPLTFDDMAAWCGCSRQAINFIYQRALRKLRNALFFRDHELTEELRCALTRERRPARSVTQRMAE